MSSTAKKIIILVGSAAVLLAVLLIILFTCGNDNNPEQPKDSDSQSESIGGLPTPEDSESGSEEPGNTSSEPIDTPTEEPNQSTNEPSGETNTPDQSTETSDNTTPETNTSTQKPNTPTSEPEDKPSEPTNVEIFKHKADTIYIMMRNVYARNASTVAEHTIYKVLYYRESYERIAISQNWSCINVDGVPCYILNEYISTTEPPEIVDTPEDTEPPVDPDDPNNPDNPDDPGTPVVPGEFVEDNSIYYVHVNHAHVRYTPEKIGVWGDPGNNVAGYLHYGNAVQAIASNGRWIRISFTNAEGVSSVCYVAITSSSDGSAILSKTPPTPIEPDAPGVPDEPVETEPETEEQPSK